MIPFEDLVASLERFKLRKSTPPPTAPNAPASKVVSGKQHTTQQGMGNRREIDELITEE